MKTRKIIAIILSLTLAASCLSGCAGKDNSEDDNIDVMNKAADIINSTTETINHSDTSGKVETVYVIKDADSATKNTIVNEWLKNEKAADSLEDVSELEDIEVVKGNAEMSEKDGKLVWKTNGGDVYYQGKTDKKLPVDVKVEYELNGKKVKASDLEHANGHLKMTFAYVNNQKKEVIVEGKKRTIYQPFIMMSGAAFDNENAYNIKVEKGTVVSTGEKSIAIGVAIPGLMESLDIDDSYDISIPENVVIEADVSDFSLAMTITVATNDALSHLKLDDDEKIDDLKEDLGKLKDGINEILDGAEKLADGTVELKNGVGTLKDGVKKLDDGAADLKDGASALKDGSKKIYDGSTQLKDGIVKMDDNMPSLSDGVSQIADGSAALAKGASTLTANNSALNKGASDLKAGIDTLNSSLSDEKSQKDLASLVSGSAEYKKGITDLSDNLGKMAAGYSYSGTDLESLLTGLTTYAAGLKATGDPTNIAYAGYIETLISTYKNLYDNVSAVSAGAGTLKSSYTAIDGGINTAVGSMGKIKSGVGELAAGAGSLKKGISDYTSGASSVATGAKTLDEGIQTLNKKVPDITGGVKKLSKGAKSLSGGTKDLSDGASALYDGTKQLKDGTKELKDGVDELFGGTKELSDGAGKLRDGISEYNEKGITKLCDKADDILITNLEILKEIRKYAKEYTSYAGCGKGVDSTVKFIFKTDSIGE